MKTEYKNLKYKIFRENITLGETAIISFEINKSKEFELDGLSHIVLKGTDTRVGFFGDNSLEIVNPDKKELREYHNKLKEIFNYTLINHY